MNALYGPSLEEDEDNNEAVYLDDSDGLEVYDLDDEDLPDAYEESDMEQNEEPDDSVHIFRGHAGELYTVACSPTDATLVATGGRDEKGFLWRIGQGNWASELQGHGDSVSNLAFSNDGQLLASGSLDGIVQVWDVFGNHRVTLEGPREDIEWLKWHPQGHLLLAGSKDTTVWMWNADNNAFLNAFVGHGDSVTCGDFTPDGKIICTGSKDATMRIWNPRSRKNLNVVRGHPYHTKALKCMSISSSSTLALTGSEDGSVHAVNISTGRVVNSLDPHSDSIECVGFAPSDTWVAVGSMDKRLVIWDIEHSVTRSTCHHEKGVTCLSWLGAYYVVTGCFDGIVRVWDSRSGECVVRSFKGHSEAVESLSLSAHRNCIVSCSLDGTARVFEVSGFQ